VSAQILARTTPATLPLVNVMNPTLVFFLLKKNVKSPSVMVLHALLRLNANLHLPLLVV
jgi:hypothetical protein